MSSFPAAKLLHLFNSLENTTNPSKDDDGDERSNYLAGAAAHLDFEDRHVPPASGGLFSWWNVFRNVGCSIITELRTKDPLSRTIALSTLADASKCCFRFVVALFEVSESSAECG